MYHDVGGTTIKKRICDAYTKGPSCVSGLRQYGEPWHLQPYAIGFELIVDGIKIDALYSINYQSITLQLNTRHNVGSLTVGIDRNATYYNMIIEMLKFQLVSLWACSPTAK